MVGPLTLNLTHCSAYFRVAFYGAQFPPSVIGKQYIYRGDPDEEVASFADKMLAMHPTAQLLTTSSIPTEDIQRAQAQYLQITSVEPQPDLDSNIFLNLNVPDRVRSYFAANETRKFCFTRLESRSSASGIVSEMLDWKLKTVSDVVISPLVESYTDVVSNFSEDTCLGRCISYSPASLRSNRNSNDRSQPYRKCYQGRGRNATPSGQTESSISSSSSARPGSLQHHPTL